VGDDSSFKSQISKTVKARASLSEPECTIVQLGRMKRNQGEKTGNVEGEGEEGRMSRRKKSWRRKRKNNGKEEVLGE
jgi:hypothetical protein